MFSTPKPGYGALLAALTLLSLAVAAPAQGQTPLTQQDAELFAKFDNDGNGQLSIAEIGAWHWGRYDQNRDGQVTAADLQCGCAPDVRSPCTPFNETGIWTQDSKKFLIDAGSSIREGGHGALSEAIQAKRRAG
jgi:hypothetical protein